MTTRLRPVTLEAHGVRLEPPSTAHRDALAAAARDGELWQLRPSRVPSREGDLGDLQP